MAKQIVAGVLALGVCACNNGHTAGNPAQATSPHSASPALTTEPVGGATAAAKYLFSGATGSTFELSWATATRTRTGSFREFEGLLEWVGRDPQKSILVARVALASLTTDDPKRKPRQPALGSAAHPDAIFRATAIVPGGAAGATHTVTGWLHLHGCRSQISFPVRLQVMGDAVQADAEITLDPKAFDIVWPDPSDGPSGDRVTVRLLFHGTMPK